MFDYIQCNMEKKITLGDLAAEACLSPYHFARAFKTLMGVPPHRYVVEKKLEYGRKLLSDGSLPICEIAQRLGFSSQSHFSRLFKNHFGATPGEYRASCS
ncbi:MAG: AraC family transcriptional regulator [Proteobacteria bacterium]|nr:AraC family transcriptional regulator [Pseudomonadota bacterium]